MVRMAHPTTSHKTDFLCVLCAFAVNILYPAFEAFLAVSQQIFVVLEIQIKAVLGWGIIFAVVVGMFATYGRSAIVDAAIAV